MHTNNSSVNCFVGFKAMGRWACAESVLLDAGWSHLPLPRHGRDILGIPRVPIFVLRVSACQKKCTITRESWRVPGTAVGKPERQIEMGANEEAGAPRTPMGLERWS